MMDTIASSWAYTTLNFFAALLVVLLGLVIILVVVLYILDVSQTRQAVRRNYPVIGRFRYLFEHMGEFFRQYFFAMDREELPFNRSERSWVYRAAKDIDRTLAFGSTRDLRPAGSIYFVNCAYPTRGEDAVAPSPITIGPYCNHPYTTASVLNISGMSYGALSKPAIQALSRGAAKSGCWLNTGEGGLSPYHLEGGCDIVFQIGTAKFGVCDGSGDLSEARLCEVASHPEVKMFEIKLSQGAKPGKGGILPGAKVTKEIATIRAIEEGEDAISPNRHSEVVDAESLLNMIARVREITGKPVGFKSVIGDTVWLEDLFRLVLERGIESAPDFITIDGAEGGSGAAPKPLLDFMGLPISESLPEVVDVLRGYGLRDRIKVIASGKMIVPSSVAWALCVGADFVVSARGFMFSLGCIQAMQCNKNTCPTGVTTHDPKLQRGLNPALKSERVANYIFNMTYDVGMIAHSCGVLEPRQLTRTHARIVSTSGHSKTLEGMHPSVASGSLCSAEDEQ
jgi:glutamate synthase domain-containing protein 2